MDARLCTITHKDTTWDNFRSELFHYLKWNTVLSFLSDVEENNVIETLWEKKKYAEAFYILALYDYYSTDTYSHDFNPRYTRFRKNRLQRTLFPTEVLIIDSINKTDSEKNKMLTLCKNNELSCYFLCYNIAEILNEKELFQ